MSRRQTGFPTEVRQVIVARAAGSCEICGSWAPDGQIHHRRPRGMGGSRRSDTNGPANGLYVDARCHSDAESNRSYAYVMGWLVPQGVEPSQVPVMRRGERVLLGDDGSIAPYEQKAS